VAVEEGEDLERVALPGADEAGERGDGGGEVADVARVGEVPGGHPAGGSEERGELGRVDGPGRRKRGLERGEQAVETGEVLTEVLREQVHRLGGKTDGRAAEPVGDPLTPGAVVRRRLGVDDETGGTDRVDERGGCPPPGAHDDEHRRLERLGEVGGELTDLGRVEERRVAHDDDPPGGEEGRRAAGVEDRAEGERFGACRLGPPDLAVLLDRHGAGSVEGFELGEERGERLADESRVLGLDEVGGVRPAGGGEVAGRHAASTAVSASTARLARAASWTRTTRQPRATP